MSFHILRNLIASNGLNVISCHDILDTVIGMINGAVRRSWQHLLGGDCSPDQVGANLI